ncbi:translocation/assembly module TamB domain-containing protein [Desulfatirhabdium butyrativorans]|uniref:translocation/assembly module TamB domain-containing protein n=1 Tax=Desulfatirhabdium butyrativorans TaxID=340467 RepID=UPI0004067FC5|nr:translocation/assembly module TamB domain-containing protein [Desulfatirhabdium butyrativorans]
MQPEDAQQKQAAQASAPPESIPNGRIGKSVWSGPVRRLLVLLLLFPAAAAGTLAWLGSGPGLGWLGNRSYELGDTQVQVGDVQGSLWGTIRMASLQVRNPGVLIHAETVLLSWRPMSLLQRPGRIDVAKLEVDKLSIELPPSPPAVPSPPTAMPQAVELPIALHVESLRIGKIVRVIPGGAEAIGGMEARLDADATAIHLETRAATSWGTGSANLRMDAAPPFSLEGRIDADLRIDGIQVILQVEPSGSLSELRLQGAARALQSQARFDVRLAPFAERPIEAAHVQAEDVDLKHLAPDFPDVRIDAELVVQPSGIDDAAASLKLRNRLPGTLDANRLPLESLDVSLRVRPGLIEAGGMDLRLAGGAGISGTGIWRQHSGKPDSASFELDLQAKGIDLHEFDAALLPTRLEGPIHLAGTSSRQQAFARLSQAGWLAELKAFREGARIGVEQFRLHANGGKLEAAGHIDTKEAMPFRIDAHLSHFDPSRFGDYPGADLNLGLQATGEAKDFRSRVDLQISPSVWQGRMFRGQLHGAVSPEGISGLQTTIRLGENTLSAEGDFGRQGASLRWRLDAPALNALDPAFSGQLSGQGLIGGTLQRPSGSFDLQTSRLILPGDVQMGRGSARGTLQEGLEGELSVAIDAKDMRIGGYGISGARLNASGRLDAHRIDLFLQSGEFDLHTLLSGGYRAPDGWQGRIETLRNAGRHPLRLTAPALLHISADGFQLGDMNLVSAYGMLGIQEASWRSPAQGTAFSRFASRGTCREIDPVQVFGLLGFDTSAVAASTLRVDMGWDFDVGERFSGWLDIERRAGDMRLAGEPALALDLSGLRLHLETQENAISAYLNGTSGKLGNMQADVHTRLVRIGSSWGLKASAPIEGKLSADISSIAWLGRLVGPSGKIDGSLVADIRATGSLGAPVLSGRISGKSLRFALPEQGLDFHDGLLDAGFSEDTLHVNRLVLKGGNGVLRANGKVHLAGDSFQGGIAFEAERLQVLDRPDRQAMLSGGGNVTLEKKALRIDARFAVDDANIELPRGTEPKLSEDVIVIGRQVTQSGAAPASGYVVSAVVRVDLADHVHISGYGLDARLGGVLTVLSETGKPLSAEGGIEVEKGNYSAYGQKLSLVKGGAVNFSGPIDNPGLNFSAQRENLPVQVGVQVAGTLQKPLISLTSSPAMSDAEALSWLVLGQDITTASTNNLALLQTAAGALLSSGQGVPITQRIAAKLGLDTLEFGGQSGLQTGIVTIGKRITSKLSLSVEQALGSAGSLFQIRYEFTPLLSVRLQSGADSAMDFFYTFRFH